MCRNAHNQKLSKGRRIHMYGVSFSLYINKTVTICIKIYISACKSNSYKSVLICFGGGPPVAWNAQIAWNVGQIVSILT